MLALLKYWKYGVVVLALVAAFWAGWRYSGALWESRYSALQQAQLTAERDAATAARETVRLAYEERLAEEARLRAVAEALVADQLKETREARDAATALSVALRAARQDPDCDEWARQPIRCDLL